MTSLYDLPAIYKTYASLDTNTTLPSTLSIHSVSLQKEFLFFPSAVLGWRLILSDSNEPFISKGMAQLGLKDNRPLAEWLDRYNANQSDLAAKPNFTTFPLDFKPSPCKPLFFDIALNHIELPSLDEKLEQNKSSQQGGLGGFLRGWWSGGEK
ncbi:signal recognition particle subunit SRP68-like [Apostichopus japonicus]|uniref:signal recognition particle subunit SRP68-like n=1 Tax=Stichopus japonicus TaxID=307972 RepID=UPI003AB80B65